MARHPTSGAVPSFVYCELQQGVRAYASATARGQRRKRFSIQSLRRRYTPKMPLTFSGTNVRPALVLGDVAAVRRLDGNSPAPLLGTEPSGECSPEQIICVSHANLARQTLFREKRRPRSLTELKRAA
jgi:hypothetical protein